MTDQVHRRYALFTLLATCLALVVVVLGAYTRLSDAGLGCPDWPGCYGHIDVPSASHEVQRANRAYPDRPVVAGKAWKEMVHRYFAGTLGLVIVAAAVWAWRRRRIPGQLVGLPIALVGLVIFQALLGMWTVTLLLKPLVVMSHLVAGLTTLALLWWLTLRQGRLFQGDHSALAASGLRPWALLGLVVVYLQISLGGWTSANYAALACPDFPTCQTQWWPPMDFREAFTLWRGLGIDYEGGVLDNVARLTIHVMHRLGALVTLLYVGWLALRAIRSTRGPLRWNGAVLLTILLVQVGLGIGNILLVLPLPVAVAHNAGGALLLLSVVTLNHLLRPRE